MTNREILAKLDATPEEREAIRKAAELLESNRIEVGRPVPGAPHGYQRGRGNRIDSPDELLTEALPEKPPLRRYTWMLRAAWAVYANGASTT